MNCRLKTDIKADMTPYELFVDEELINALDNFLELSPGTNESKLILDLQVEFKNIPADFITKLRLPAGLKMGDPYRTPVLNWLLAKVADRDSLKS